MSFYTLTFSHPVPPLNINLVISSVPSIYTFFFIHIRCSSISKHFCKTHSCTAVITAKHIKSAEVIDYEDLGTEAIHRFYVEDMPLVVIIDSEGNNLYETEKEKYKKK